MTLKTIVENWLTNASYDGLYGESCGCEVADLMPCDEPGIDCKPGYKKPCPRPEQCKEGGDCDFHISPTKS